MIKGLVFVGIYFLSILLHPVHIAVTDLVYNSDTKSIEVTHKIFIDDLEKHIESEEANQGRQLSLKLNTPKENAKADLYLKEYLEKYFKVVINGRVYSAHYIGKEYETDAIWLYAEIKNVKNAKMQVQVTDAILLDLYEDQSNLVHIKAGENKKSMRFNRGNRTEIVSFRE